MGIILNLECCFDINDRGVYDRELGGFHSIKDLYCCPRSDIDRLAYLPNCSNGFDQIPNSIKMKQKSVIRRVKIGRL